MKSKHYITSLVLSAFIILIHTNDSAKAASITTAATGTTSSSATWPNTTRTGTFSSTTSSRTITGTSTLFTTEFNIGSRILNASNTIIGVVESIQSNTQLTLTNNAVNSNVNTACKINGIGPSDDLIIAAGHQITINENLKCASLTFNTAAALQTSVTLTTNDTLTVTGSITMPIPSSTGFNCIFNINDGAVICNTFTMSATTTGRNDIINITTGSLNIAGNFTTGTTGCIVTITGAGNLSMGGTVGSFTFTNSSSSTIAYTGGAVTVKAGTYFNLKLGGTGNKTITGVTVNSKLTIEGTTTLASAITYGSGGGLIYNTSTSRTASSNEWPTTFTGTGGITISNTGIITLNQNKTLNSNVHLTINANATLSTNNFALTFSGNFINNGTFDAGSSNITIAGTANQSVGAINTTGVITSTKTANTATFTNDINAGGLVINGSGGALSLGAGGFSHSFSSLTLTLGTLKGGNSSSYITGNVTKTSGTFTPETSSIDYSGGTQSIALNNYYNLISSGTGTKTITTTPLSVGADFRLLGSAIFTCPTTATITGNINIEETSKLIISQTLSLTGNLTVGNNSAATLEINTTTGAKTIGGHFTINTSAIFNNSINEGITIGGDFIINGTATFGTGIYNLTGANNSINANSSISIPNINISGHYINNTNLTISGSLAGTGTLENISNSVLNFNTNSISITSLITTENSNTVVYSLSGDQSLFSTNYYHLILEGSGIKTFRSNTTSISGDLTLNGTATTSFMKSISIVGNLTINNGSNFIAGAFSPIFNKNITINTGGLATWTSSTLIMNGSTQSYTDNNTTPSALNNLTLQGNGLKTINANSILGNVIINDNDSLLLNNTTLTINGNFTIGNGNSGYFKVANLVGAKYFVGHVTINSNAIFDNSIHSNTSYAGNFTCNGSLIAGSATYTFTGNTKTISGTSSISLINLAINGSISNTTSIAVNGSLSGTGTFTNKNTLFLTSSTLPSIQNFNASDYPNTVYYSGGTQTLYGTNYYNLVVSGSGIKSFLNSTDSIKGYLSFAGSATYSSTNNLVILGDLNSSSTASISLGSYIYQIGGNVNLQSGTSFNFTNASITFNGTTQSITNSTAVRLSIASVTLIGGVKTFVTNTYITFALTINVDAFLNIGNTSTLFLNCTISGEGKIMGGTCGTPGTKSISFEKANWEMGSIYIDESNNNFYRIHVLNNARVSIMNDFQVYDRINLYNGILTVWGHLYLSTSNTPIVRSGGNINFATTSSLTFGGCNNSGANFTIPNNSFLTPPQLVNFTIQRTNGVNIGTNSISLTGTLNLLDGNLQTNGILTLKSNANGAARVAPISSSASISGDVSVERYIPGGSNKRKWRLLSFPINISGSVQFIQLKDNILITAPAGAAQGFDVNPLNPANTASLRTYTESVTGTANNGWTDPSSINSSIATGLGYEVFVRGSRSLANPYLNWTVPDDVTLDYKGALNTGSLLLNLSYTNSGNSTADGFNLIGNPYASPINFDTTGWTKTNIQNKFWSYNPNTGAYGIYDADLHTGTNSITKYIASSQGFFVKATAASPSITFTENIKCINSGNNYFRPTVTAQNLYSMFKIGISNDSSYSDETMIVLDENASSFGADEHDAYKWFSDALNIYTLSKDNTNLNIDARNYPTSIDTIPLAVFSYNGSEVMTTHHQFTFTNLESISSSIDIVLWDKYLNTYTNCKVYPQYDFNITSENTSYGKNRFALLIGDVNIGIDASNISDELILYPNPSSSTINLTTSTLWENKTIEYKIIDQSGRIIIQDSGIINKQHAEVDISAIQSGLYVIEILSESSITRRKFIKE